MDFMTDPRFSGVEPLKKRALLASPTMHDGEEMTYVKEAYDKGWMTTVGDNINIIEKLASEYIGTSYAVALACGTAALHLAVKLAAERLYHSSTGINTPNGKGYGGSLLGKRVFCSDLTFGATVNPVVYEGGEPVFIDSEQETWNMDPEALEKAFSIYPDVRLVVFVHLYGTPGKIEEIKEICKKNNALLIEDAAESMGAEVDGRKMGSFGDYGILSFNGNKIITGSSGGMLLVKDRYSAEKARKWSTQAREEAPWYEHQELGYNYRISNVVAGVIRGQWKFIDEHIKQKRAIYDRYKKGLEDLPITMNPVDVVGTSNYWLSCLTIDPGALSKSIRSEKEVLYKTEKEKTCPTEILEVLNVFNAEGRPIWKPMHLQPIYRGNAFITTIGDYSSDLFDRGVCLPSDNKMTISQQEAVIDMIHRCFGKIQ